MPHGTFVEFISGKDDLPHISEIGWKRLETVVLVRIVAIANLAGSTETKAYTFMQKIPDSANYPGFFMICDESKPISERKIKRELLFINTVLKTGSSYKVSLPL